MTVRVVCWNIDMQKKAWQQLVEMKADVALLQEASSRQLRRRDEIPVEHWNSHCWNSPWYKPHWPRLYGRWSAVVRLSERVKVDWFKQVSPISDTKADWFPVSGIGTVAAARITPNDDEIPPFIVVSMYARWIEPHICTKTKWKVGYADGSAHRIISDLSAFIGDTDPSSHRILAAGDLNMENSGEDAFRARESSVWERFKALGLEYLGPQVPNGRPTPACNKRVVTYKPTKTQLDHAFASRGFHENVKVRALNSLGCWGASDHCRLLIEVGPDSGGRG